MNKKKWYQSKTLWTNIVATVGITAQVVTGKDLIPAEQQVLILSLINIGLRTITKTGLE